MRLVVAVVGKARHPALGEAIRDYEERAARYWPLDVHEVREERASGVPLEKVMQREGERLAERIPDRAQRIACETGGEGFAARPFAAPPRGAPGADTDNALLIRAGGWEVSRRRCALVVTPHA